MMKEVTLEEVIAIVNHAAPKAAAIMKDIIVFLEKN